MNERYVHLTQRLSAALELIGSSKTVADIGCDHGRLCAALLQSDPERTVVATDISEESLRKAQDLLNHIGVVDRVSFRVGDGLQVLKNGECDTIAMLGMGGTLMVRILEACAVPLCGARTFVVQPMRAQAEIRSYLHKYGFRITDDRIVREGQRLYQILRAEPDACIQAVPNGWPGSFYDIGFVTLEQKDPLLPELIDRQLWQHQKRLATALGTDGEQKLRRKIEALESIRSLWENRSIL